MPAMLQEGDYLFPQEASLQVACGEASATIAIWNVRKRRPEHEFKSAFSTHSLKQALNSNDKPQTLGREVDCSRDLDKLDANEPLGATVKYAWVTPYAYGAVRFQFRRTASRPALEAAALLLNERRSHDEIGVERCGADGVTQPLVLRYCTTVPIRR